MNLGFLHLFPFSAFSLLRPVWVLSKAFFKEKICISLTPFFCFVVKKSDPLLAFCKAGHPTGRSSSNHSSTTLPSISSTSSSFTFHHPFPLTLTSLSPPLPPSSPSPLLILLGVERGKASPCGGSIADHATAAEFYNVLQCFTEFYNAWNSFLYLSWLCCWTLRDHSGGTNLMIILVLAV